MHLRNRRRSWSLRWCERYRWGDEGLLPLQEPSLRTRIGGTVPLTRGYGMLQQLWSFNPFSLLLAALSPVPTSKRDCQLQREGKNKRNVVYALGQRCHYSLLCWNMLSLWRSAARRPTICNLAAGISVRFLCWKPPWKWQHPGYTSHAFTGVLSTCFLVALWQSNAERTENKGRALPRLFKLEMMF